MAAPTFIAKGTVSSGTGAGVTPTYPGSILAGDLLFLVAMSNQLGGSIGSIDGISGWAVQDAGFFKDNSPVNVGQAALFVKVAAGGESGTVSVTRTGDTGSTYSFVAQIYQFRGVPSAVIESEVINNTGDGNSTVTWSAVTVGGNARTLVAFGAFQVDTSPGTPSGYTASAQDSVSTGSISVQLDCFTKVNVGADGVVTVGSGPSTGWVTFHVSLLAPAGRVFIFN